MRKITSVQPLEGYRLRLRFDNAFEGILDMSGKLWGELGEPLKDPAYFARVFVSDCGSISWPNDFDLCPNALYYELSGEAVPEGNPVSGIVVGDPN